MKKQTKVLGLLLATMMLGTAFLSACKDGKKEEDSVQSVESVESVDSVDSVDSVEPEVEVAEENYNIIFALATIPPVLAAMDCIDNGYETYAVIERGKTYSGIEEVDTFHNAGFDVSSNKSTGFTTQEFNDMVAKVRYLNDLEGDSFFNIYVQDGTALKGAAVAANAGLTTDQFHIYMCEDGTGAYTALNNTYIKGKTVNETTDEAYDTYAAAVEGVKAEFETIMSKTDNVHGDYAYNIGKAYALAALENFTYYIQDEATVVGILESTEYETKLLSAFGVEGYDAEVDYKLNLKYQKIAQGVANLSEEERTDYLTLMYGQYYEDTYAALTRTQRADQAAPAEKLVFIGSRHNGYPKLASNAAYGIGGLAADEPVPATYEELDDKYKTSMLFATEEDYTAFLAVLNNTDNYAEGTSEEVKELAKTACFNVYIDYIFTLKMTYAQYGESYDLIMKGHPREIIGGWNEWGNRYKVTYTVTSDDSAQTEEEKTYVYDKLLDNALLGFHANDSTGKYIGMVPYGTAAENLAYLGADIAICGLPSSTYNGYDTDVDVLFVMTTTNEDITGSGNATAASQVKERFEAGNLLYTDENGEKQTTLFWNLGNIYKTLAAIGANNEDWDMEYMYTELFEDWLAEVHADASDIDGQGFAVTE